MKTHASQTAVQATALVLTAALLFSSTAPAFAQASLWADRRQDLQASEARRNQAGPIPDFPAAPAPGDSLIPSEIGTVVESYRPARAASNDLQIIHIQDAHGYVSAQKNLARMLRSLASRNPGANQGLLVCAEGAWKKVDLEWLHDFPDPGLLKTFADTLIASSQITGEEYEGILAGESSLRVEGAEDEDLYRRNARARETVERSQSEILGEAQGPEGAVTLRNVLAALQRLKPAVYPSRLRALEQGRQAFDQGRQSAAAQALALSQSDPAAWKNLAGPDLDAFLAAAQAEKALDLPKMSREREELLRKLGEKLDPLALARLGKATLDYRSGALAATDYYRLLIQLARLQGMAVPALERYAAYLEKTAPLDLSQVQEALTRAEIALEDAAASGDVRARKVLNADRWARRQQKLWSLEMSPAEWDACRAEDTLSWSEIQRLLAGMGAGFGTEAQWARFIALTARKRQSLRDYYFFARRRDTALVERTLRLARERKVSRAVLVAGGFHTRGIARLLREQNIAYTVLRPNLEDMRRVRRDDRFANAVEEVSTLRLASLFMRNFAAFHETLAAEMAAVGLEETGPERFLPLAGAWLARMGESSRGMRRILFAQPVRQGDLIYFPATLPGREPLHFLVVRSRTDPHFIEAIADENEIARRLAGEPGTAAAPQFEFPDSWSLSRAWSLADGKLWDRRQPVYAGFLAAQRAEASGRIEFRRVSPGAPLRAESIAVPGLAAQDQAAGPAFPNLSIFFRNALSRATQLLRRWWPSFLIAIPAVILWFWAGHNGAEPLRWVSALSIMAVSAAAPALSGDPQAALDHAILRGVHYTDSRGLSFALGLYLGYPVEDCEWICKTTISQAIDDNTLSYSFLSGRPDQKWVTKGSAPEFLGKSQTAKNLLMAWKIAADYGAAIVRDPANPPDAERFFQEIPRGNFRNIDWNEVERIWRTLNPERVRNFAAAVRELKERRDPDAAAALNYLLHPQDGIQDPSLVVFLLGLAKPLYYTYNGRAEMVRTILGCKAFSREGVRELPYQVREEDGSGSLLFYRPEDVLGMMRRYPFLQQFLPAQDRAALRLTRPQKEPVPTFNNADAVWNWILTAPNGSVAQVNLRSVDNTSLHQLAINSKLLQRIVALRIADGGNASARSYAELMAQGSVQISVLDRAVAANPADLNAALRELAVRQQQSCTVDIPKWPEPLTSARWVPLSDMDALRKLQDFDAGLRPHSLNNHWWEPFMEWLSPNGQTWWILADLYHPPYRSAGGAEIEPGQFVLTRMDGNGPTSQDRIAEPENLRSVLEFWLGLNGSDSLKRDSPLFRMVVNGTGQGGAQQDQLHAKLLRAELPSERWETERIGRSGDFDISVFKGNRGGIVLEASGRADLDELSARLAVLLKEIAAQGRSFDLLFSPAKNGGVRVTITDRTARQPAGQQRPWGVLEVNGLPPHPEALVTQVVARSDEVHVLAKRLAGPPGTGQAASVLDTWARRQWGENSRGYRLFTVFAANWEIVFLLPALVLATLPIGLPLKIAAAAVSAAVYALSGDHRRAPLRMALVCTILTGALLLPLLLPYAGFSLPHLPTLNSLPARWGDVVEGMGLYLAIHTTHNALAVYRQALDLHAHSLATAPPWFHRWYARNHLGAAFGGEGARLPPPYVRFSSTPEELNGMMPAINESHLAIVILPDQPGQFMLIPRHYEIVRGTPLRRIGNQHDSLADALRALAETQLQVRMIDGEGTPEKPFALKPFFTIIEDGNLVEYAVWTSKDPDAPAQLYTAEQLTPEVVSKAVLIAAMNPGRIRYKVGVYGRNYVQSGNSSTQDDNAPNGRNSNFKPGAIRDLAGQLRVLWQGLHHRWYISMSPYPIWPPDVKRPPEEQPNHFTVSMAEDEVSQRQIGRPDCIQDALVLFREMNGQSGPSGADGRALTAVIAGIIRDIQGIRGDASTGEQAYRDFNLLLAPQQEEVAGQNYRLAINGWHSGATQFHAHMQSARVAFPIERAHTQPHGRIGRIQVSLLDDPHFAHGIVLELAGYKVFIFDRTRAFFDGKDNPIKKNIAFSELSGFQIADFSPDIFYELTPAQKKELAQAGNAADWVRHYRMTTSQDERAATPKLLAWLVEIVRSVTAGNGELEGLIRQAQHRAQVRSARKIVLISVAVLALVSFVVLDLLVLQTGLVQHLLQLSPSQNRAYLDALGQALSPHLAASMGPVQVQAGSASVYSQIFAALPFIHAGPGMVDISRTASGALSILAAPGAAAAFLTGPGGIAGALGALQQLVWTRALVQWNLAHSFAGFLLPGLWGYVLALAIPVAVGGTLLLLRGGDKLKTVLTNRIRKEPGHPILTNLQDAIPVLLRLPQETKIYVFYDPADNAAMERFSVLMEQARDRLKGSRADLLDGNRIIFVPAQPGERGFLPRLPEEYGNPYPPILITSQNDSWDTAAFDGTLVTFASALAQTIAGALSSGKDLQGLSVRLDEEIRQVQVVSNQQ